MINCICINDKNKPKEIPGHKWVKEGEEYTIIFAIVVLPQRRIGFQLEEITLDESCHPYEYFLAERFALRYEDIEKLIQFIYECTQINISVKELIKETNVTERTADSIEAD
jgi:hypothetical protein